MGYVIQGIDMKFGHVFIVIFLLAFLYSCCPSTSLQPLSPIEQAQYDKRLEGTWIPKQENGETGHWYVGRADGNLTKAIAIEIKESGKLNYSIFTFFPTTLGKYQFLNIKASEFLEDQDEPGYIIVRYDFTDRDTLNIYYLDPKQFAEAINSNHLKGEIIYGKRVSTKPTGDEIEGNKKIDCVHLNEASSIMQKYLSTNSPEILFPAGIQFVRGN